MYLITFTQFSSLIHRIMAERGIIARLLKMKRSSQQCNTNIKFFTEYNYEYIRKRKYHQIWISNVFISRQLTECEYQIYLFLATWPNMNIEFIHSYKLGQIRGGILAENKFRILDDLFWIHFGRASILAKFWIICINFG